MAEYTNNLCVGGIISANIETYGNSASVFNGVALPYTDDGWGAVLSDPPNWVQYEFTEDKTINKIKIFSIYGSGGEPLKEFTLSVSPTGVFGGEETLLLEGVHPETLGWSVHEFTNELCHAYYRVHVISCWYGNGGNQPIISEIEMMAKISGRSFTIDQCEGGTATANYYTSFNTGGVRSPDKAFDNIINPNVFWDTYQSGQDACWITYDFGVGNTKRIQKYTILPAATAEVYSPKDWVFKGSNNNTTWIDLDTQTNQMWSTSSINSYIFSNKNLYRYYKLDITRSDYPGRTIIQEIEMMEEIITDVNPDRSDNFSELYRISSKGNLRGKAAEGFIRPTLKQFFTSYPSFIEITSNQYMVATGGTITTDGDYKIHSFTSDGTFNVTFLGIIETVQYLVVAGGGGGGGQCSGGGGAGGLLTDTDLTLTKTSYSIVVGDGGTAGTGANVGTGSYDNHGGNGGNSSFHTVIAIGGGGTSGYNSGLRSADGGSGGGGSYTVSWGVGKGTSEQGHDGGIADKIATGGGGGGAGGVGSSSLAYGTGSGWGGLGLSSSITGTLLWYAGGGGGGTNDGGSASPGGSGVGGSGGYNRQDNATQGMDNRGGGGGGSANTVGAGKEGGSGIVIIRYKFQ